MSRRPKPTAIRELEGNASHRPINTEEPKAPAGIPEMPKGLRKTAQREWRRMSWHLDTLGVLTIIDGKALAMYCDAYADWEEAQKDCTKNGLIVEEPIVSKAGDIVGWKKKPSPAFTVKCMAMKLMKSFLIEFGMTPASRTKLRIDKKPEAGALPTREDAALAAAEEVDLSKIDETLIQ